MLSVIVFLLNALALFLLFGIVINRYVNIYHVILLSLVLKIRLSGQLMIL